MDFICCDDFKEDVVNIILLGYREKVRKLAKRGKKSCTFHISSFTHCKGISFLSTAEPDQVFTKTGSKRWVSLSEKLKWILMNSAHFTFRSLWLAGLRSWKDLQSCRQIIFPKPSHVLPATKTRCLTSCRIHLVLFWDANKLSCWIWYPASPVERRMHEINVSWPLQQHHFCSPNF